MRVDHELDIGHTDSITRWVPKNDYAGDQHSLDAPGRRASVMEASTS